MQKSKHNIFIVVISCLLTCTTTQVLAQQNTIDTSNLFHAFRSGKTEGQLRYFFSATDNSHNLTDYYAHAAGGAIRYESARFHGFNAGIGLSYVFNLSSSDLTKTDSITKQLNRYEVGLFDVTNTSAKKDITRLEEFFVAYKFRKSFVRLGRQIINTPFINPQDGRMRPTAVEGIWAEWKELKNVEVEGGWLYAISPRSTTHWYHGGTSVGLYPVGTTASGKKSEYAGNISSSGIGLLGIKHQVSKNLRLTLHDLIFDNVLNTNLLQADFNIPSTNKRTYLIGLQFIRQDALHNGGNNTPDKTYISKGAEAMVAGGRIGAKYQTLEVTANYTHIFNNGRYLMPREWGRDPFYTFIPRERNEGLGGMHAFVGKIIWNNTKHRVKVNLSGGYFKLPDVKNTNLNKYGLPSYTQINADIKYTFNGVLKGLDMQLLIVAKQNNGETYNDLRYEFNKVNMMLYNVVLNYNF